MDEKITNKQQENPAETTVEEKGGERKIKKKSKAGKITLFAASGVVAMLLLIYGGIALSYQEKFLPNTFINGVDCSGKGAQEAADLLDNQLQNYRLEVIGRDASMEKTDTIGSVTAQEISVEMNGDTQATVKWLLENQNVLTWGWRKLSNDTYSNMVSQGISYDKQALESAVRSWDACKTMKKPENAYIGEYSDALSGYEIVKEVEGTTFDVEQLLELMDAAILSEQTTLDLEEAGCYQEPAIRQDDAKLQQIVGTANQWLQTKITYDWNGDKVVVDKELLKDWVKIVNEKPVLDEEAAEKFVKEEASEHDTYGKKRNFVTTLGVELTLPSGYYGWKTDVAGETEELLQLIQQGAVTERDPLYINTAMQKGKNDIGNSYVEIDLSNQHLYLYQNGAIVFETDFVSGSLSSTPDCITPAGVFGISYKTKNAVLRGANYATPVNYWMPFYGNYGMHDATWRSSFGGQIYVTNGSHGCVNLPLESAATIYQYIETGFPVVCYYYQDPSIIKQQMQESINNDVVSGEEESGTDDDDNNDTDNENNNVEE